jgi:hypothetical protein
MKMESRGLHVVTSLRLRGEVGSRNDPAEGDSARIRHLVNLPNPPLTPTLAPQARGEAAA